MSTVRNRTQPSGGLTHDRRHKKGPASPAGLKVSVIGSTWSLGATTLHRGQGTTGALSASSLESVRIRTELEACDREFASVGGRCIDGLPGLLANRRRLAAIRRPLIPKRGPPGCPDWEPSRGRMRHGDKEKLEPAHPLSEDVSPPVFAIVALFIVAISLAVFALLGVVP